MCFSSPKVQKTAPAPAPAPAATVTNSDVTAGSTDSKVTAAQRKKKGFASTATKTDQINTILGAVTGATGKQTLG